MGKGTFGASLLSDTTFGNYNANTGTWAHGLKGWGQGLGNNAENLSSVTANITGAQGKAIANAKTQQAAKAAAAASGQATDLSNQQKQDNDVNSSNAAKASQV